MKFEKIKLYLWLFGINLFISAFTFGGGYVVVPMIRKYFVEKKKLFQEKELLNMAAVAQSTPGAIAINLSSLAGYHVAGIWGIIISSAASVLPPLLILSVISKWYTAFAASDVIAAVLKGMQAGVAALIVDLIVEMIKQIREEKSVLLTLLVPLSFLTGFLFHIHVAVILFGCCLLNIIRIYSMKKKLLTLPDR